MSEPEHITKILEKVIETLEQSERTQTGDKVKIRCCIDCVPPKRHVGCHSTCEEYLKEKAEWDAVKEEERKNRMVDYTITNYDIKKMDKWRKKKVK